MTSCVHHWLVGAQGKSHCKKCGAKDTFPVVFEYGKKPKTWLKRKEKAPGS